MWKPRLNLGRLIILPTNSPLSKVKLSPCKIYKYTINNIKTQILTQNIFIVSYPEYQNHEELDIEIEDGCAEDDRDSHSRSKLSIASADSGHHQMPSEEHKEESYYPMQTKEIKKGTF